MAILLAILFWLVVALFVVLVGVLVTPVHLRAHLRNSPQLAYRVDARILGGLSPRIRIVDSLRPRKTRARKQKKAARSRWKTHGSGGPNIMSALPRLVSDLLRAVRFEHLRLEAEFGLGDPADTGQLYGLLIPLQYSGYAAQDVSISMRPNFERACLDCELDVRVQVTPASFLLPIIRFAWNAFGVGK